MSILISIIAFIFLLSFLVILHEFGHYATARWFGVDVEEFGFGLPPRALTLFWKSGTRFTLNWIPFGGFVRLQGENGDDGQENKKGSFASKSIPARIAILTAGVVMNFLLAILIFTIGFAFAHWIPTYLTFEDMLAAADRGEIHLQQGVLIDQVLKGSPAAEANVPAQSILLKVDDQSIYLPSQVQPLQAGKESVVYTVLTGEKFDHEKTVVVHVRDSKSGVELQSFPRDISAPRRDVITAFVLSLREAKIMTVQTIYGIAALFQSLAHNGTVPKGITGIVGIAQLTYASVQQGFMTYLRLVALLSLSLAVMNILPFPALDGGRVLFIIIEMIRRRPARRFEGTANMIGFICLIGLILIITYYDIRRLF